MTTVTQNGNTFRGSRRRRIARPGLVAAVVLVVAASGAPRAEIQNDVIGFSPNHVFDGAIQGENVDVMTGNVSLSIPLGPDYRLNDWFGSRLVLHYNSRIWEHDCPFDSTEDCPGDFVGPDTYGQGFVLHFGRVYHHPDDVAGVYRYQTPDGADHFFCTAELGSCPVPNYTVTPESILVEPSGDGFVAYPGDGTRVILDHQVGGAPATGVGWYATRVETLAEFDDGGVSVPQQRVEIRYGSGPAIDRILHFQGSETEVEAREIDFTYAGDVYTQTTTISFPWIGEDGVEYQLITELQQVRDPTDSETPIMRSRKLLKTILLPELSSAESYNFSYGVYGALSLWRLPTGAEMSYNYTYYRTSENRPYHPCMYLKTLTANGTTYRWSYTRFGEGVIESVEDYLLAQEGMQFSGSNPYKVRVLDPFDNLTVYYFHYTVFDYYGDCDVLGCRTTWDDGLLHHVDYYAGPLIDGGRLVRQEDYEYTRDSQILQFRCCSSVPTANTLYYNVRQSAVETVTPGSGFYPTGRTRVVYDDWTGGAIQRAQEVREYEGLELFRTTYTDWLPQPAYHDVYRHREVRDAAGQVLSRTDALFDLNRLQCSVRRVGGGLAALDGCDDGSLQLAPGDVAVVHAYDQETGDLVGQTVKGGDNGAAFAESYTRLRGVLESSRYEDPAIGWLAVDRTVDEAGLVLASRDPAGVEVEYDWDDLGRLTTVSPSAPELPTEITYVDLHETRVRQQADSQDFVESVFLYDDLGRAIEERRHNAEGAYDFRRTEYDIAGRVTRQSEWSPENADEESLAWTVYEYGAYANPNAGEPGEPDRFVDPLGRVSKVVRPDGSITETDYEGLATTVTVHGVEGFGGPALSTSVYVNDVFGRLRAVDSPADGVAAAYLYDELDRLVEVRLTDPNAASSEQEPQRRFFEYDTLGRLRWATNPENGTVTYRSYDARGKLLSYLDAAGRAFDNTWDAAGRLVSNSTSDRVLVVNRYDVGDGYDAGASAGKLTQQTSYQFGPYFMFHRHRLVSTKKFAYGSASGPVDCPLPGLPVEEAYLGLNGRLAWTVEQIQPWGQELRTEHCQNPFGAPNVVRYPDFETSLRTRSQVGTTHKNGYVERVVDYGRIMIHVAQAAYDPHGAIARIERGNGVLTAINRDAMGRPLRFEVWSPQGLTQSAPDPPASRPILADDLVVFGKKGGEDGEDPPDPPVPVLRWGTGDYVYDGAGNVTRIGLDRYYYDQLNRLVGADVLSGGTAAHYLTYSYDAFGNMTGRVKQTQTDAAGVTTVETVFSVDPARNQLLSATVNGVSDPHSFDPNGNLSLGGGRRNVFDVSNRLVEVRDATGRAIANYDYDADGYRVRAVVDGVETYYLRDGSGQLLSEFKNSTPGHLGLASEEGVPLWDKDYIYALGQAVSLVKNDVPSRPAAPWIGDVTPVDGTVVNVTVRWHASPESDIERYRVERRVESAVAPSWESFVVQAPATSLSDAVDRDDLPDLRLYYSVVAVDAEGHESPRSPSVLVRLDNDDPPPTPAYLMAVDGLDRTVTLFWDAVTTDDGLAGYYLERTEDDPSQPDAEWALATPALIPRAGHLDPGRTNGVRYCYRVRAVDTAGDASAFSDAACAVPRDSTPPGPPTGVSAQPGLAAGEIVVMWNPVPDSDLAMYVIDRSGCGSAPAQFVVTAPNTFAVDGGVAPLEDCAYTVRASDTSGNTSEPSAQVIAQARGDSVPAPGPLSAEFRCVEDLNDYETCVYDMRLDSPDVMSESFDHYGVFLDWSADGVDGFNFWRIYRAPGTSSDYRMIAELPRDPLTGEPTQYLDEEISGYEYSYYVVAMRRWIVSTIEGSVTYTLESAACQEPPCSAVYVLDDYDSNTMVRNVITYDGCEDFDTDNARSRRISVAWSKVHESQLQGYHVYRRCEWGMANECAYWWFSMHTFACEHAWVRLTARPISGDTLGLEDATTGGLNGVFTYAVRPVGPGGQEGPLRKIVGGDTSRAKTGCDYVRQPCAEDPTNDTAVESPELEDTCPYAPADNPYYDNLGGVLPLKYMIPLAWELNRVNAIQRGAGAPAGPPAAPTVWRASEAYFSAFDDMDTLFESPWTLSQYISWERNQESDLAGYHVEIAGSVAGPWQRLTKNPVAWWEDDYTVKGISYWNRYDPAFSPGHPECAHLRVIAVDEEGNESEPGYAMYFDPDLMEYVTARPGCGEDPTPPAPRNLRASTEDDDIFSPSTRLEWDVVPYDPNDPEDPFRPENVTYYVYRLPLHFFAFLFYVTHIHPGSACTDTTCSYVEEGDFRTRDDDPEIDCPIKTTNPYDPGCVTGNLEAYYVTAQALTGGESPKSNIVFWKAAGDAGYAGLRSVELQEFVARAVTPASLPESSGPESGMAEATAVHDPPVCESAEPLETTASALPARGEPASEGAVTASHVSAGPLVAPLLKLGQVFDDPPWEVLDLHVDHLGSTRLVTDASGAVVARHDFLPFGEEILPMVDDNRKMFTGHERDRETGLDYMFARYYGANLGRFLSADPLMASAKVSFPQSWNRYSYAFNNPVRFIDPLGLENTVFMVNAAGVDDETMETAQKREGEVVEDEGLTVEVVDEAPDTLDDTDRMQVVTTSDKAELKGPGTLENAEVGGQKSEIYVDRIGKNLDTNLGEGTSSNPTAMGNAIGNVGAHAVGHNLGKGHPDRSGPIDLSTPEPDVMVSPMTAVTLVSDVPRFVAKEE